MTADELLIKQQTEGVDNSAQPPVQTTGATPTDPPMPRVPQYRSSADFDAEFTRMLMEDEKKEREQQEKINQRKQLAQVLGDLGQSLFNDVIKASGGALVTPRDVQARYDKLDERGKQIYDNYRARMDAIRQKALKRMDSDRDKADSTAQKQNDREYNLWLWQQQRKAKEAEAENTRQAAAAEAEKSRKSQENLARIRTYNYNSNKGPDYVIDFGDGERYTYKDYEGANVYGAICQYMLNNGIIPNEVLQDKDGNVIPIKTQEQADLLVRMYFGNAMQDPKHKAAIYKIVTGKDKDFRDPSSEKPVAYPASHPRQQTTQSFWQLWQPSKLNPYYDPSSILRGQSVVTGQNGTSSGILY